MKKKNETVLYNELHQATTHCGVNARESQIFAAVMQQKGTKTGSQQSKLKLSEYIELTPFLCIIWSLQICDLQVQLPQYKPIIFVYLFNSNLFR